MATEGYHEVTAAGVEDPGAVRVQIRTATRKGVDPVSATVDRQVAAITYRANLAVVKTADDMLGETMDLLG
jgi:flagellar basal body rod protein FlgC